jgi:hypothetical protein
LLTTRMSDASTLARSSASSVPNFQVCFDVWFEPPYSKFTIRQAVYIVIGKS